MTGGYFITVGSNTTANTTSVWTDTGTTTCIDMNHWNITGWKQEILGNYAWLVPKRRKKVVPPHADLPIRKPPPREFNRYINGSDLLEEFIRFLGRNQVRKAEALQMPLELFIQWLIIEAAKADNEEPPLQLRLPPRKARCLQCSRVLRRRSALMLCSTACVMRQLRAA